MLNSCQEDENMIEAPSSKSMTIRAGLPGKAQSKVILGDTEGATTKVYWEADDKIKLTIESTTYTFSIKDFTEGQSSAEFVCNNPPTLTEGTEYTFTYAEAPAKEQTGTKEGLSAYHQMKATHVAQAGDDSDNVTLDLQFKTTVAIVEITLPGGSSFKTVSLYDSSTGAKIASANGTLSGKAYFAVEAGTQIGKGLVLADMNSNYQTNYNVYVAEAGGLTLQAGNLYRFKQAFTSATPFTADNLRLQTKYLKNGSTMYIYNNTIENPNTYLIAKDDDIKHIVVLEGGVEAIYQETFRGWTNLESVTISTREINTNAFENCTSLKTVNLSEGLEKISGWAFKGCTSLTQITIPASVTWGGANETFKNCINLKTVTCLGTTPPTLYANDVFDGCPLTNIYVPAESVDVYKAATDISTGWSNRWKQYENIISAIPE